MDSSICTSLNLELTSVNNSNKMQSREHAKNNSLREIVFSFWNYSILMPAAPTSFIDASEFIWSSAVKPYNYDALNVLVIYLYNKDSYNEQFAVVTYYVITFWRLRIHEMFSKLRNRLWL